MTEPQDASERARRPLHLDNLASRAKYGSSSGGDAAAPQLPAISPSASLPGTPRGQLGRPLSGSWNSPGGSFRQDDEVFVIELGARYLRLGLGGENTPRAVMSFGPASRRRPGDYSAWVPKHDSGAFVDDDVHQTRPCRPDAHEVGEWASDQQLYPLDLRSADMALIALQLERAIRQAVAHHLLAIDDSKRRAVALAVQPQLPHPLMRRVLDTIFAHFPSPYQVAMISTPMCAVVAAGLRSALVVDIGWAETTVSAVYEMRELEHRRSERAMRRLNWEVAKMLTALLDARSGQGTAAVTFDDCEEIIWRLCHCRRPLRDDADDSEPADDPSTPTPIFLPSQPPTSVLEIPFKDFSHPVESAFFSSSETSQPANERPVDDDDNLLGLPTLIYTSLLRLPPDVRGALLPRIVITGGGSHIPRLTTRLLADVTSLIRARGWDPVCSYGSSRPGRSARSSARMAVHLLDNNASTPSTTPQASSVAEDAEAGPSAQAEPPRNKDIDPTSTTPASEQPQLPDDVLAKIQRLAASDAAAAAATPYNALGGSTPSYFSSTAPTATGATSTSASASAPAPPAAATSSTPPIPRQTTDTTSRGVQALAWRSLGAWTGASLLAGLRQRGVVEVERETYTAAGLAGADRDGGALTSGGGPLSSTALVGGVPGVATEDAGARRAREQQDKRQSVIGGGRAGERRSGSWTLGAWA